MLGGVKFVWDNVLSLARIGCLFFVVLFLPKFFLIHINSSSQPISVHRHTSFCLGLENLSDDWKKIASKFQLPDTIESLNRGKTKNQTSKVDFRTYYDTELVDLVYKKPNPAYSYEIAKVFQEFVIGVCYWHALQKIVKFKLIFS